MLRWCFDLLIATRTNPTISVLMQIALLRLSRTVVVVVVSSRTGIFLVVAVVVGARRGQKKVVDVVVAVSAGLR